MRENLAGLVKILGIIGLLVALWMYLYYRVPETFLSTNNIENLLRRTALYGILGIGVAFVIISSGIDLSIGSFVCFSACLFAIFLQVTYDPLEQTDVWAIDKETKTMMISDSIEINEGDDLWYDGERRDTGPVKIAKVERGLEFEGHSVVRVTLEKAPRKTRNSEQGKPVGSISKTYALRSVGSDTEFEVESNIFSSQLGAKDKVKLLHPTKSKKERVIQSVEALGEGLATVTLADPAKGIDTEYRVLPIKRSAWKSIPEAIGLVILIALAIGIYHGVLITYWNQRPFIVTLCGLLIFRGLSRWLTNDQPVGFVEYSDSLGWIASGRWIVWESADKASTFGIPYSVFFLVVIALIAIIFLNSTIWGRYMLALGRNEEAARYSGINTKLMTITTYVICSVLAAIGGILFAIDSNSVAPSSFGNFFELYAIAAAVLGGCSLRGGEGSIIGVVVGTALMQTLYNSIVLLKIPDELEFTIIGAVILLGVSFDELIRRLAGQFRKTEGST